MSDYLFYDNDHELISIEDIYIGTIFKAKDVDGNYITDEEGNNTFEAVAEVEYDPVMGPYVSCKPVVSGE